MTVSQMGAVWVAARPPIGACDHALFGDACWASPTRARAPREHAGTWAPLPWRARPALERTLRGPSGVALADELLLLPVEVDLWVELLGMLHHPDLLAHRVVGRVQRQGRPPMGERLSGSPLLVH